MQVMGRYRAAILTAMSIGASLGISAGAWAGEVDALKQKLRELYPNTAFEEVRKAEIAGLYELRMGKTLVYTDAEARHFLFGHLYDMRERKDITAARLEDINRVVFDKLPADIAVVFRQGAGTRKLAVFSDPDCPYCRQLETELAKLNDVTIYLYMLPLPSHPAAKGKVESVWCAKDRAAAWRSVMAGEKQEGPGEDCAAPTERLVALAKALSVNGTPTLVAADGRRKAGALSAEAIESWINGGKSQ